VTQGGFFVVSVAVIVVVIELTQWLGPQPGWVEKRNPTDSILTQLPLVPTQNVGTRGKNSSTNTRRLSIEFQITIWSRLVVFYLN